MGPERGLLLRPERLPFPALLLRLLQVPEQGPHQGQALPQPSRGWSRYARGTSLQFAVGSGRVAEPSERKRLRTDEGRWTIDDVRENEPCYVWGSWFL